MGSGNSIGYAKIALVQWYNEGKKLYGAKGFEAAAKKFNPNDLPPGCLAGKIVAVTGANQGIGYETALACAKLGAEVRLLCRNAERAKEAADKINAEVQKEGKTEFGIAKYHIVDMSVNKSVRKVAAELVADLQKDNKKLHGLVNNAGLMPSKRTKSDEGCEVIAACTYFGCLLLTALLIPVMESGSRVVNVSSGGAYTVAPRVNDLNFDEITEYDGTKFYAVAKRNQILMTEMLAEKFKEQGILFNSMHPGWSDTTAVQTAMPDFHKQNAHMLRDPAQGADTVIWLTASPAVKDKTGLFWFDREAVPHTKPYSGTAATDEQKQELWKNMVTYCGGEVPAIGHKEPECAACLGMYSQIGK